MEEEVGSEKGKKLVAPPSPEMKQGDIMAAAPPQNFVAYPRPMAEYEEVARHPELFMRTLEKLHATMGSKFMIPTIGGRELDLHRVFVEVTSRGGIQKVIGDKRWREVIASFNFPSTATNASFVLRKYYMSLLHHYEQIYFQKLQGWTPVMPAVSPVTPGGPVGSGVFLEQSHVFERQVSMQRRRRANEAFMPSGLGLPVNSSVSGVIDGKCEHGYFVTVTVGSMKLKGILFHILEPTDAARVSYHPGVGVVHDSSMVPISRRRRRRKKLSTTDPTHPKPNRSGYNFFFAEQHARLKPLHPGKDREISKMIGDLWNNLLESEKAIYQEKGVIDKERYRGEMEVYRQKQRDRTFITTAVPLQQRPSNLGSEAPTDAKMDFDGGDYQNKNSNSFSDGGACSELQDSDTNSEQVSPEADMTGTESTEMAVELSNEGEAFEVQKRDDRGGGHAGVTVEQDRFSASGDDAESKKVDPLTK